MSRKKQVHTVRSRQKQKTFRTLLSSERLEDRCMLTASVGSAYDSVSSTWFASLSHSGGPASSLAVPVSQAPDSSNSASENLNEWIVRLNSEATKTIRSVADAAKAFANAPYGIQVVKGLGLTGQLLLSANASAAKVGDYLKANPLLAYAEQNMRVQALQATPNDPKYTNGDLWGLNNSGQNGGVADADIDAPEAWDITTGSRSVVVAVIDTGIDYNHPDLRDNMWRNPGETPGDNIDNDGNGFIDDVYGWDFYNNDASVYDSPADDHGTHVAGTIAGRGNNEIGVVGVNWVSSIMSIKFLGDGGGPISGAIASVNYATMMKGRGTNIRVTNNSWGGGGYSEGLKSAIEAGGQANILFVAAAGNSGTNNDIIPSYPSSYDSACIVSVAATDRNDKLASFSQYGKTSVDIGAPGVSIWSNLPENTYGSYDGTSMATPQVSGVAALVLAINPTISVTDLKAVILDSADKISSLAGKTVTGGRLNAFKALEKARPFLKLLSVSPSGTVLPPSSVSQITVRFSQEALGASVVNGNFLLVGDGDDGEFGSETAPGDDVSISISDSQISQALDGSQGVVTISFSSPLLPDRYRLTLKGTGSNPLRNGDGLPLSNGKDLSSIFLVRANTEPNDWMENAINVSRTSGRIVFDENIGDGAYGSRDVDMFKVTLAQSQLFIADIDALRLSKTSLFNSYLRLFDSKGNQILANNDFAESADSYLEFRAKEAGTYYVGVSGYGNSSYLAVNGFGRPGSTGDYRLSLTFETVAVTPSPLTLNIVNITPNPRTEAVPEIVLEFNRPASGFDIGDLGLTRNNQTVSLVGTTLVSSDNKRWILTGLSTKTSDLGAYSFTVNVGGSGIQDQFGLMLSSNFSKSWIMSGPVVPPPPPSLVADFGDAIPDSYNVIFASNSNIQTKSLSQKIGDGPNKSKDVDILKLTLSVGSRLDIDVNARSLSIPSKLDSFVRLFDSTGKQLAYNDNDRRIGKTSPDSFLTFEVKTAGVYYVGISGSGNAGYNPAKPVSGKSGSLGDYTVEISVSSAAMTSPQASVLQSMAFSLWQASQSTSSSTPKATRLTF